MAEIRINSKGIAQSKIMPSGQRVPNFGFVVFETDAAVQECLKHTPVHLPDGHRLNVETKKNNKVSVLFLYNIICTNGSFIKHIKVWQCNYLSFEMNYICI